MKQIFAIAIPILLSFGSYGQTKETEPDYLLRLHGPWLTHESDHFRFYYRENPVSTKSLSDKDIKEIVDKQEKNILRIAGLLNIPKENIDTLRKINVWLFRDLKEKDLITKIPSTDFSIRPYWSAYHTYISSGSAHEIGHLIINEFWGWFKSKKYQFLIEEGYASIVDEGNGKRDFDYYLEAKKILKKDGFKIEQIVNNEPVRIFFKNPYTLKAIVSGAFVKYLLSEKGVDKFKQLFQNLGDDEKVFEEIYEQTFSNLIEDFYKFIDSK